MTSKSATTGRYGIRGMNTARVSLGKDMVLAGKDRVFLERDWI